MMICVAGLYGCGYDCWRNLVLFLLAMYGKVQSLILIFCGARHCWRVMFINGTGVCRGVLLRW